MFKFGQTPRLRVRLLAPPHVTVTLQPCAVCTATGMGESFLDQTVTSPAAAAAAGGAASLSASHCGTVPPCHWHSLALH